MSDANGPVKDIMTNKAGTDRAISIREMAEQNMQLLQELAEAQRKVIYWVVMSKLLVARLFALSDEGRLEVTTQDMADANAWELMMGDPYDEDVNKKGQVIGMFVKAPDVEKLIQSGGAWGKHGIRTAKPDQGKPVIYGPDGHTPLV